MLYSSFSVMLKDIYCIPYVGQLPWWCVDMLVCCGSQLERLLSFLGRCWQHLFCRCCVLVVAVIVLVAVARIDYTILAYVLMMLRLVDVSCGANPHWFPFLLCRSCANANAPCPLFHEAWRFRGTFFSSLRSSRANFFALGCLSVLCAVAVESI